MHYVKQMVIIGGVSFAGEVLNRLLPLPIPGSIYGLVLMLMGLLLRVIPLKAVRDGASFLISIMPVMFIGPTVGLMASYPAYRDYILPFVLISVISTVVVMAVAGRVTQRLIRMEQKKKRQEPQPEEREA